MLIHIQDHDAEGAVTSSATPRYAHDRETAQGYMLIQAGDLLQSVSTKYRVALLDPGTIRLEKTDGTGGTTFTITD